MHYHTFIFPFILLAEEYKDVESGAVVKNHYKYGKLAFSEMFSGGKKAYDVHYDNDGKITRSRNYNKKGEVITELEFYENGQVKTRTEVITKDGRLKTIVSKFDDKGNSLGFFYNDKKQYITKWILYIIW